MMTFALGTEESNTQVYLSSTVTVIVTRSRLVVQHVLAALQSFGVSRLYGQTVHLEAFA